VVPVAESPLLLFLLLPPQLLVQLLLLSLIVFLFLGLPLCFTMVLQLL
jgi:hypothetical protein